MQGRPNRVLALVVAAICLVAVVAAVVSATRSVTEYDRDSPAGVVQAYLTAVIDGDDDEAVGFLADDSPCTVEDLDRAHPPDETRVVLRDTDVDGDRARVEVDVVMSSAGPFDSFEFTEEHTFRLSRTGGDWLIEGAPWPMFECTEEE